MWLKHQVKLCGFNQFILSQQLKICVWLLADLDQFAQLCELHLYSLEIVDVSCLGSVYDLNLSYCGQISDVNMLWSVQKLSLSHFSELLMFQCSWELFLIWYDEHWCFLNWCWCSQEFLCLSFSLVVSKVFLFLRYFLFLIWVVEAQKTIIGKHL